MEISLLKSLLNSISYFLQLSSCDSISVDLVKKYYQKAEEILKLMKPVLDAIFKCELSSSDEVLNKMTELGQLIDELKELFENWLLLSSKICSVIQIETLLCRIRTLSLDSLQLLNSSNCDLPEELSSTLLELFIEKLMYMDCEEVTLILKEALRDEANGVEPSSELLVKIGGCLDLMSNQEILIEAVALEKLKENAEQAEKTEEAHLIDPLIAIVTRLHDRLLMIKQSQNCSPVPIPPDFCCPLSLELMIDPVIVASGQTYERAYIKTWIELGLAVCPKTRQTLGHTNLIPNYTVKALIANWCESNTVKLSDPVKFVCYNHPSPLVQAESGVARDSHIFLYSRSIQQLSPKSSWSAEPPAKKLVCSTGIQHEEIPFHPSSTSGSSLSDVIGNGRGSNVSRISLTSPEERSVNFEKGSADSVSQHSASLSEKEVSNSDRSNESQAQSHSRISSANVASSNANFLPVGADARESLEESSTLTAYDSDTSGEVKSEIQASNTSSTLHRQREVMPRIVETTSQSQNMWRRPSDRLVPRIISSPSSESRADLSSIEIQVRKLVEDLKSSSLDTQREATAELRVLARNSIENRIVIADSGAINLLVELLRSTDTMIQENVVTTLLNLTINDNNKTTIANANAIEPLIHVLQVGSPEAKENSAATLFSLSVVEENKVRIGRSGAIGPLVDLLGNGAPRGKKDAATALFNLSIHHENKLPIVQAGAVKHLVDLMDPAAGMVDKAVAVLSNLATIPEGRTAIGQERGIPVLVEVVELGSSRGKENAAAALLQLCTNSNRFCNSVIQEGAVPPLVVLSQTGTPRAKEKAQQLLRYFRNQRHGNAGRE